MKRIIHHLRNRSEQEKRDILHLLTIIFAFFLIMLWFWSLGANFLNTNTKKKIEQDLKPLSVLKDNLVGEYQNISQPNLNVQ